MLSSVKTLQSIHRCFFIAGKKLQTAEGAESSDEEGGSRSKKLKTLHQTSGESSSSTAALRQPVPSVQMLSSPFVGMGGMAHYLGGMGGTIPLMGAMQQHLLAGNSLMGATSQQQQTVKQPSSLFPSAASSGPSSSSGPSAKATFAAYGYVISIELYCYVFVGHD